MYFDSEVNSNRRYHSAYKETAYIPEHFINPCEDIHSKIECYQEDKSKSQIFYRHKETGFIVSLLQILLCAKSKDDRIHIRKVDTPVSFNFGDDMTSKPKINHYEYSALDIPFSRDFEVITYSPKTFMKRITWLDMMNDLKHCANGSYINEVKDHARNQLEIIDILENKFR